MNGKKNKDQENGYGSQLQAILEHLNEGLVIADQQGNLIHWNQAALTMLGFTRLEQGLHPLVDFDRMFELKTLDGEQLALEQWPMTRLLHGESYCRQELYTRRRDSDWERIFIYSGARIELTEQNFLAFLTLTDVTEQKQAETILRTGIQLSRLAADIGHTLTQSAPLGHSLRSCCEILVEYLDAAFARIWLLNDSEQLLELHASAGLYTHIDGAHARIPVGHYKIGRIAQERLPHLTNDVQNDPRVSDKAWAQREGMIAFAGYPLICEERMLGVMAVFARRPLSTAATEAMGSVAGSIALGIERRRTEETLFAEKERAQVTLRSIGDAVITTDRQGIIEYLNPIAESLTGWPLNEARGRLLSRVFHIIDENTRVTAPDPVMSCLAQGGIITLDPNTLLLNRDGKEYAIEDSTAPIRDRAGTILGTVLVFHDVTEQRRLSREISHQAMHDELTGLLNRREFERRLSRVLSTVQDDGSRHALCYLDLDRFKIVNDSCGHIAGDELLRQLARRLQAKTRWRDTLARLGGDEFGLLLEHCPPDQAERIADGLRKVVEDFLFVWNDNSFRIGVSIGLVPIDSASGPLDAIFQAADQACYEAKEQGRNRIQLYRQPALGSGARQHWPSRLKEALHSHHFTLYGQRIMPVAAGAQNAEGIYCELLLRLQEADGSILSPGAFMPAAVRYQLATRIDRWVLEQVFTLFGERTAVMASLTLCTINLSASSVSDSHFQTYLLERLDALGDNRTKLCFEISESTAVTHLTHTTRFIEAVKTRGCRFALDGFGSGLSSFIYLKTLPVDFLKIDGVFVRDIADDPVNLAMVRSINEIAQLLGKRTIAEYVESEAILSRLRELGVDYVQGYHLGRPRPLQELLHELTEADGDGS